MDGFVIQPGMGGGGRAGVGDVEKLHDPLARRCCWNVAHAEHGPEPGECLKQDKSLDKAIKRSEERHQQSSRIRPPLRAMIFRLRRLTPGYFRLLQMQLASGPESEPQDRLMNQLALLLAIMGLSLSCYSARQMSEDTRPHPEP